jgi:hypothetical protein
VNWPEPAPGQLIRYSFLWKREAAEGREEGAKDRPCAIIVVVQRKGLRPLVRVLPVTHAGPSDPAGALEIPLTTKRRLGLDSERSWIMLDEANDFTWPGPDLRPARNGDLDSIIYGKLPPQFRILLAERLRARRRTVRLSAIQRTE